MVVIKRETDYAFRALASLARSDGFLAVTDIAASVDVPVDFLRKIMQRLHQGKLVESRQGPFGGYRLAAEPHHISFRRVVEAIQGPVEISACFAEPGICSSTRGCSLRRRMRELQESFDDQLDGASLADILEESVASRQHLARNAG